MKIILTQEVTGLGAPGDVAQVKDGYGRNYLLPRGYAIAWTRGAEKQIETIQRARSSREIRNLDDAQSARDALEKLTITLPARAGESGRLFGAVTPADIAAAVSAAGGPTLDRRRIEVGTPIKTVGIHEVTVRLHSDVPAKVRLDVVGSD